MIQIKFQNDTDGMPTLKSIAQEATNRAGLKVPSSHANQQTQMQSIGTTAPTISQSGKNLRVYLSGFFEINSFLSS